MDTLGCAAYRPWGLGGGETYSTPANASKPLTKPATAPTESGDERRAEESEDPDRAEESEDPDRAEESDEPDRAEESDEPEESVCWGIRGVDEDCSAMVGTVSTVIPSAEEAAAAVARLVASADCKAAAVFEAGTAMEAVMSTEAAVTLMATNDSSTPARAAMELRRAEVF